MPQPEPAAGRTGRRRDLYFFTHPSAWELWPFLPLVRRRPGREQELGVLFDALGVSGVAGHSATVFLCNYFLAPPKLEELLALPKEVFDAPEEIADAGWRVD